MPKLAPSLRNIGLRMALKTYFKYKNTKQIFCPVSNSSSAEFQSMLDLKQWWKEETKRIKVISNTSKGAGTVQVII